MFWSAILGLLSAAANYAVKALDYFKFKQAFEAGKEVEKGDIAAKEVQVDRKQDEIMMTEQTKSETVKRLENGTF